MADSILVSASGNDVETFARLEIHSLDIVFDYHPLDSFVLVQFLICHHLQLNNSVSLGYPRVFVAGLYSTGTLFEVQRTPQLHSAQMSLHTSHFVSAMNFHSHHLEMSTGHHTPDLVVEVSYQSLHQEELKNLSSSLGSTSHCRPDVALFVVESEDSAAEVASHEHAPVVIDHCKSEAGMSQIYLKYNTFSPLSHILKGHFILQRCLWLTTKINHNYELSIYTCSVQNLVVMVDGGLGLPNRNLSLVSILDLKKN